MSMVPFWNVLPESSTPESPIVDSANPWASIAACTAEAESVEDRDSSFRIHLALHELEEPYREVFELRVFGELSFRDIGTIFQKTENWARVTYHRAKIQLQERMGVK